MSLHPQRPHRLPPYGLLECGIASLLNGVFLAFALLDFAVDQFAAGDVAANAPLLASWISFRHGEQLVTRFVLFLALGLPVLVWQLLREDVAGLLRGPGAHRLRHAVGAAMLIALLLVVAHAVLVQRPREEAVAAGMAAAGARWPAITAAARRSHLVTLVANILQLPLPFLKAAAAADGARREAAAAAADAAVATDAREHARKVAGTTAPPAAAAAKTEGGARRRRPL